ncbi:MAG: DUF3108 domain-containing protein [Pseudomonadota bacterium]
MKRTLFATVAAALCFAGTAVTDSSSERPSSPMIAVEAGQPMRVTYELKASAWVFILPITGKAGFTADLHPDSYRITSSVRTTGLADILVDYNLALSATGYTSEEGLSTYAYISQNRDGKKNRRVELTYGADDVAMTATPAFGNLGDPAATPEQKIDALDPISALINFGLEPRTDADKPCGGPIKIFDGRQLSWLHLTYAGMTDVRSDAWRGEALECHVVLEKVAGFNDDNEEEKKETMAGIDGPLKMFLAPLPNGATWPVRIEADTDDIGKVVLQASKLSFEPIVVDEASAGNSGG